jgi:hypothetical protein
MYGNQNLIKAYKAAVQIGPNLIVKFTANPGEVTPGAAAADKLIGVSVPTVTAPATQRVDVVHEGITEVKLGVGGCAAGDLITSDATGQGVVPAPAAGTNNGIIGRSLLAGVAGDIVPVLISIGMMQG